MASCTRFVMKDAEIVSGSGRVSILRCSERRAPKHFSASAFPPNSYKSASKSLKKALVTNVPRADVPGQCMP